jgi:predicted RND superfamily exporter protein
MLSEALMSITVFAIVGVGICSVLAPIVLVALLVILHKLHKNKKKDGSSNEVFTRIDNDVN